LTNILRRSNMATNTYQKHNMETIFSHVRINRGMVFGVIIITALLAFEIFNYSTTDFALTDLLGDLKFMGLRWATILSIAFCGIDFAGIARLFAPEPGKTSHNETWYLFGAWLLAATMNALLTWWGVSLAILNHQTLGNAVLEPETLLRVVPIFVAILVWLIRVLIIGTFSIAGDQLFELEEDEKSQRSQPRTQSYRPISPNNRPPGKANEMRINPLPRAAKTLRAASSSYSYPRQEDMPGFEEPERASAELIYQPISMDSYLSRSVVDTDQTPERRSNDIKRNFK
jgi:hypothetical protein